MFNLGKTTNEINKLHTEISQHKYDDNSNSTLTTKPRMLPHDKHTHAHLELSTLYMSVTKE